MDNHIISSKPLNGRAIPIGSLDFDRKHGMQIYAGDCKELNARIKMSYSDADKFCKNFLHNPDFREDTEEQENKSGLIKRVRKILLNN